MGGNIETISDKQIISDLNGDNEYFKRGLEEISKCKTLKEAKKIANEILYHPIKVKKNNWFRYKWNT